MSDVLTYGGNSNVVKHYQNVNDIMQQVERAHELHTKEYDTFSNEFWNNNVANTCSNLWQYCKRNIKYTEEPKDDQTTKSPGAILILAKKINEGAVRGHSKEMGGLDCKHYSLFCGGIIDSLRRQGANVDWCYRFVSYYPDDNNLHHVFVVVSPNTNNEIFVDPVLTGYNLKKKYYYFCDVKPKDMLRHVSGVNEEVGKKEKHHHTHHKLHIKLPPIKLGKVFMKVANSASRNSFLLLLKMNVFNMATRLWNHGAKDHNSSYWKRLSSLWNKLGGNPNKLSTAIDMGHKHHEKHLAHKRARTGVHGEDMDGVGVVQAAGFAAVIAAATPIIAALSKLLKEAGINTGALKEHAEAGAEELHDKASNGGDGGDGDAPGSATMSATTKGDGTKELTVHDVNASHDPATDDSDNAPDVPTRPKNGDGKGSDGDEGINTQVSSAISTVKNTVINHRKTIIYGTAGVVAVTGFVRSRKVPKKNKTMTLVGTAALTIAVIVGGNMLIPKE